MVTESENKSGMSDVFAGILTILHFHSDSGYLLLVENDEAG